MICKRFHHKLLIETKDIDDIRRHESFNNVCAKEPSEQIIRFNDFVGYVCHAFSLNLIDRISQRDRNKKGESDINAFPRRFPIWKFTLLSTPLKYLPALAPTRHSSEVPHAPRLSG